MTRGEPVAPQTKVESMNESEDPESTRDASNTLGKVSEDNDNIKESGFERADVLSVTVLARGSSAQSSGRA